MAGKPSFEEALSKRKPANEPPKGPKRSRGGTSTLKPSRSVAPSKFSRYRRSPGSGRLDRARDPEKQRLPAPVTASCPCNSPETRRLNS